MAMSMHVCIQCFLRLDGGAENPEKGLEAGIKEIVQSQLSGS